MSQRLASFPARKYLGEFYEVQGIVTIVKIKYGIMPLILSILLEYLINTTRSYEDIISLTSLAK
jgi:hypothetical protein